MINPDKKTILEALRLMYILCICAAFILTGMHMGYQVAGAALPGWVPMCTVATGGLALLAGLAEIIIQITD